MELPVVPILNWVNDQINPPQHDLRDYCENPHPKYMDPEDCEFTAPEIPYTEW